MTRRKRAITLLAALALTVALAAPAMALGDIDLTKDGTITTTVAEQEYRDDLQGQKDLVGQEAQVGLKIYKVAEVNQYGAFTATEDFKSLEEVPEWNDGIITNKPGAESPAGEAQVKTLLELALALVQEAEPAEGEEGGIAPVFAGEVPAVGGLVELGAVEEQGVGLYLVVPEHVTTVLWEYEFSPALLAVPSIDRRDAEGNVPDPDDGEWVYEVPMYLKCERERRLMDLDIVKNLLTYNKTLGPATFVFEVLAYLDTDGDGAEELVFQSTAQVTFDETTGAQSTATVKNIPAGAHVTVREVYTGQSYDVVGPDTVTFEITELTLPEGQDVHRVEFTNDYTGGRTPDAHVENVFTKDSETGWTWHSDKGGNG